MEEGLLPHARAVAEGSVEEERRLAYVGITRAMATLTLSWASERAKYGRRAATVPSRFLFEARGQAPPEGWVGAEAMAATPKDAAPTGRAKKTAGRVRPSGRKPARRASRSRPRR
jgi:ATP-dependent exoDNAse (exonuclease V) beta subunit